jgi:hypothetical protein
MYCVKFVVWDIFNKQARLLQADTIDNRLHLYGPVCDATLIHVVIRWSMIIFRKLQDLVTTMLHRNMRLFNWRSITVSTFNGELSIDSGGGA